MAPRKKKSRSVKSLVAGPSSSIKKKTPRKLRATYTQNDVLEAIKEIKEGQSIRSVSRKYNIPRGTLHDKINGRTAVGCKMGHPPYLTESEEKDIVQWIKDANRRGMPPRKEEVLDTSKKIVEAVPGRVTSFAGGRPERFRFENLLKRHPELAMRTSEKVSRGKAAVTEVSVQIWFQQLYLCIHGRKSRNVEDIISDPTQVYNTDETCIQLCPNTGKVISLKGKKNVYQVFNGSEKENLTFIGTFSASGEIVAPMVYPYVRLPDDIRTTIPPGFHYLKTKSGWMTADAFQEFIETIFNPHLLEKQIQKPVILLVDGHKTHINLKVSVICEEAQIMLYLLPPNTTHLLQPADVCPFKPLKSYWRDEVYWHQQEHPDNAVKRRDVAPYLKKVLSKITKESISNGFKRTGLYPFNVEEVDFSKIVEVDIEHEDEETTGEAEDQTSSEYIESDTTVSTQRVFSKQQYEVAKNIIKHKLGSKILDENKISRVSLSTDLYKLWKEIVYESQKPVLDTNESNSNEVEIIPATHTVEFNCNDVEIIPATDTIEWYNNDSEIIPANDIIDLNNNDVEIFPAELPDSAITTQMFITT